MQAKRCIEYLRVSSTGQRENHSLPTQRTGCDAFAEEHGWRVVDRVEEVFTATELSRPRLDEVRDRVARAEADVVLVYDQDRLSRKAAQTIALVSELEDAGAEVWSVRQGRLEIEGTGRLVTYVRGTGAEIENEQRTERAMRAQYAKVAAGALLGNAPKPTYGYRWPDERRPDGRLVKGRYEVEPETAAVVVRIYDMVLAGVPLRSIANRLNAEGVPSPYAGDGRYAVSGQWRHQTIKSLVANPKYKGEAWALAQRQSKRGRDEAKRKRHTPVLLPEGVVPALVSEVEWGRAQEVTSERVPVRREVSDPDEVVLRGVVRCGVCGRAMRLAKRGNGNRYYQCNKMSSETGACGRPSPSIKTSYIEQPVWVLVRSVLLDPTRIWDRFESREQHERDEATLAGLRGRLANVQQRRARLLRNLELVGDDEMEELLPRLTELGVERDNMRAAVEEMEHRVRQRQGERDRISRLLGWARSEVGRVDAMTPEERRAVLLELGVVVRVYPTTAPERYTVELGARLRPDSVTMFADVDWQAVREPTPAQRRETAKLEAEAAQRGYESDIVAAALPGSADGHHPWDYWDRHVVSALAQHARVLGLDAAG